MKYRNGYQCLSELHQPPRLDLLWRNICSVPGSRRTFQWNKTDTLNLQRNFGFVASADIQFKHSMKDRETALDFSETGNNFKLTCYRTEPFGQASFYTAVLQILYVSTLLWNNPLTCLRREIVPFYVVKSQLICNCFTVVNTDLA